MSRIKVLEELIDKGKNKSAIALLKELKKKYKSSPSLTKILKKIESDNDLAENIEDIIKKECLDITGDKFGDYSDFHGSDIRILIQSLITSIEGEKNSYSTDLKSSIRIYEGQILIPLQSVVKSRYQIYFKNISNNVSLHFTYSKSHTSLPNKTSFLKNLEVIDNNIIVDVDPQKGQFWLVIRKDIHQNCLEENEISILMNLFF